jgi:hypothetical protein
MEKANKYPRVYRVVAWNPVDYAQVCAMAQKEQRTVNEFIRSCVLDRIRSQICKEEPCDTIPKSQ